MDRTQANVAPAGGDDPTVPREASGRRAVLVALAVALLVGVLPGPAFGASEPTGTPQAAGTPAAATSPSGPSLELLDQSWWTGPTQSTFSATLTVTGAATAGFSVEATVYSVLSTRSAFGLTLGGRPTGYGLSHTVPVPLSSLPAGPGGGVVLTVAVGTTTTPPGPASLNLHCYSCDGVYPVQLQLVPTGTSGGTGLPSLVTHLVYVGAATAVRKLDFAWVLPLNLPPGTSATSSDNSLSALGELATTVSAHPAVPVTLEPEPASLEAVDGAGASGRDRAGTALQSLLGPGSVREVLAQTYVPVDPAALLQGGLGGDLTAQIRRAAQILAPDHPTGTVWVAPGPTGPSPAPALDQNTLNQLAPTFADFVLPPASVTGGGACGNSTCSQPFPLSDGVTPTPNAITSDPQLQSELAGGTGGGGGDVLAAHQLLADLALIHFELPSAADDQRGVVLAPLPDWADPDPTFVDAVLTGLGSDPLVAPVTVSELFADVHAGGNAQPTVHRPATGSTTGTGQTVGAGLSAKAVRAARARQEGFASAVSTTGVGSGVAGALGDSLLASESLALQPHQAQARLDAFNGALDHQLGQLRLDNGSPVHVTSSTARVPITVFNDARYPVRGTLTVTSDNLVFVATPGCRTVHPTTGGFTGVSCQMTLDRASNAVYVEVRARKSGNFLVSTTVTSPDGRLVLVNGSLTVRSFSTSLVAVVLSLGAVAVLLVWWGRTLWRGRRTRRGAHVRGAAGRRP